MDAAGTPSGRSWPCRITAAATCWNCARLRGGTTALLPFTKAFVPVLDMAQRRVTVVLPEDFFAPPGEKPADDPG